MSPFVLPLFFTFLQSYHPSTSYSLSIPTPPPISQVLGTSTLSPTPTPTSSPAIPLNVGGQGQVVTIAVLGDSMIETLGTNIPSLSSSLQSLYPFHKFNILNFGRGSTTLDQALKLLPDIISQKPDIIIIESFAYNNYGNAQEGFDKQWLNLGAITTALSEQLPQSKILLAATIAPDSVNFASGVPNLQLSPLDKVEKTNTIKLYLQNLVNFASSQRFPLADAYHPSLINNQGRRELINTSDHLHPSPLGASFFSSILAKAISDNKLL